MLARAFRSHSKFYLFLHSLFDICNYHYRIDLIKLMIASLDFAQDLYARAILSKILTTGSKVKIFNSFFFFKGWGGRG